VEQSGVRANIGWAVFGHEGIAKLDLTCRFVERWQGAAGGRITTWLAPHSPYLCDRDFLRATAERARALGVGIHIHCSETHDQVTWSLKQYGITPPAMLREAGVFQVPVLLAHGIALTPNDLAMLSDHDVAVAQCPKTYLKLAMGTAPVRAMRAAGLAVGIGTDGVVSSNTLDVLEQMRLLALDQKQAAKDSTVLPIQEVLAIAFAGGAQALRQPAIGALAASQLADVVLMRQDGAHLFPRHDPLANLVYSARAGDVATVICDGKVLMRDRQLLTIDLPAVKAEVAHRLARLSRRAAEQRLATYPIQGRAIARGEGAGALPPPLRRNTYGLYTIGMKTRACPSITHHVPLSACVVLPSLPIAVTCHQNRPARGRVLESVVLVVKASATLHSPGAVPMHTR
jgi:5-methylthioadenosine/S-adenosylhomocysteine deaminase